MFLTNDEQLRRLGSFVPRTPHLNPALMKTLDHPLRRANTENTNLGVTETPNVALISLAMYKRQGHIVFNLSNLVVLSLCHDTVTWWTPSINDPVGTVSKHRWLSSKHTTFITNHTNCFCFKWCQVSRLCTLWPLPSQYQVKQLPSLYITMHSHAITIIIHPHTKQLPSSYQTVAITIPNSCHHNSKHLPLPYQTVAIPIPNSCHHHTK